MNYQWSSGLASHIPRLRRQQGARLERPAAVLIRAADPGRRTQALAAHQESRRTPGWIPQRCVGPLCSETDGEWGGVRDEPVWKAFFSSPRVPYGERLWGSSKGLRAGAFPSPFSAAQVNKWCIDLKRLYFFILGDLIQTRGF